MDRIVRVGYAGMAFLLVLFAAPAAAQSGSAAEASSLPPPVTCLHCGATFTSASEYQLRRGAVPRSAAPAIGTVVGAVIGFVSGRIICAKRFCEMGELVPTLAGAVLGYSIGTYIKDPSATPPRRW